PRPAPPFPPRRSSDLLRPRRRPAWDERASGIVVVPDPPRRGRRVDRGPVRPAWPMPRRDRLRALRQLPVLEIGGARYRLGGEDRSEEHTSELQSPDHL